MRCNAEPINPIPQRLLYELPERTSMFYRTGKVATVELSDTPALMFPMVGKLVTEVLNWQEGRNVTLFRVACRYFELSTKGLLGADALHEIHEAALQIGLTPDEIERTLTSARRSI